MKTAPFDLDKALAGHPLVTRDGRVVTDFQPHDHDTYLFKAEVAGTFRFYTARGFYYADEEEDPLDLFLLLETPSQQQVGGAHYKSLPIQPAEYCQRNKLTWCEANVVKYVTRHREKNGRQDIEKAIHYLELLLELEYPTEQKP